MARRFIDRGFGHGRIHIKEMAGTDRYPPLWTGRQRVGCDRGNGIKDNLGMQIKLAQLLPFQEICRKICINIPESYHWHWDEKRNMAAVVLQGEDAEMVFYPLFKEFSHHWNFSSAPPPTNGIQQYVNDQFGLMPGQVVFTSYPLFNLVLCVAWWPWGEEQKVSMRIGLIPVNNARLRNGIAYECLRRWVKLSEC